MDDGRVTETIRARFKRRKRRSLAAAGIGFAVMAIAAVLGYLSADGGSRYRFALLVVAVLGLVILSGALLYLDRTRCLTASGVPARCCTPAAPTFVPSAA